MKLPLATLFFDGDAPEDHELSVTLSPSAVKILSTMTDFELKVFATESSMVLREALELPPSPPSPPPKHEHGN